MKLIIKLSNVKYFIILLELYFVFFLMCIFYTLDTYIIIFYV